MNVRELREELEGLDDDVEVRVAHQPSWPFEYSLSYEICNSENLGEHIEVLKSDDGWYLETPDEGTIGGPFKTDDEAIAARDQQLAEDREELGKVIWLVENRQVGYLPGPVSKAIGWR